MVHRPGSYHDPYDAVDVLPDAVDALPEYPLVVDPSHGSSNRWKDMKVHDAEPLVKGGRREGEPVPLDVDGFAYELGRVHRDLDTLRNSLDRLAALKMQVLQLSPEDGSLVAQSLLADLNVQTTGAARLLADLPAQLRGFAGKIAFLKPGAGRFLVTSGETAPLKNELAECAEILRASLREIQRGDESEEQGKPEARVRLLKVIKVQMGHGVDDSQMMAALLSAEREGSASSADQLKVRLSPHLDLPRSDALAHRPEVPAGVGRLNGPSPVFSGSTVCKTGDLSFLDSLQASPASAQSSWLNPLAYLPTLPLKTPHSSTTRPPSYLSRVSSVASASAGTGTRYAPLEEDRVGSYGEPLDAPATKAPSRWERFGLGAAVLAVLFGSGVAIMLWSKQVQEAAGTPVVTSVGPVMGM
ncbi:hypothetical protein JCM3770_003912 [Rhodotorula araucariae]